MNPFPPAALAALAAGLDEYRLITPDHERNPHEAVVYAAEQLVSAGWMVQVQPERRTTTGTRRPCPVCTTRQLVRANGQLRRHGAPGHPCAGSGAIPEREPAA